MNIAGWEYDFESLPRWENREVMKDCKDYLTESGDESRACLIYSVTEVSMMYYLGFCAIFQNKENPELLLHIPYVNFEPYAKFSKDGKLLFLKALYRYGKRFVLVIDLDAKKFAIFHFCAPFWYDLTEIEGGRFQIVFDMERDGDDRRIRYIKNTLIDPEQLIWRKWKPLAEGGDLHLRQRGGWRDRFKSPDQVWAETIDLAISQQIGIQEFVDLNYRKTLYYFVPFTQRENGKWYSRRESNSHGFERQIFAPATDKFLAISYIASKILFASAKYLLTQNCEAPSGVAIFDRFWWDFAKQDTNLAS